MQSQEGPVNFTQRDPDLIAHWRKKGCRFETWDGWQVFENHEVQHCWSADLNIICSLFLQASFFFFYKLTSTEHRAPLVRLCHFNFGVFKLKNVTLDANTWINGFKVFFSYNHIPWALPRSFSAGITYWPRVAVVRLKRQIISSHLLDFSLILVMICTSVREDGGVAWERVKPFKCWVSHPMCESWHVWLNCIYW